MAFIKVPQPDTDKLAMINTDHITVVFELAKGCEVSLSCGSEVDVAASVDELKMMIEAATREPLVIESETSLSHEQQRAIDQACKEAGIKAIVLDPVFRVATGERDADV